MKKFGAIFNFTKHQKPYHREKPSDIPPPPPPEKSKTDEGGLAEYMQFDTARALIEEKITEEEAGFSKKIAGEILDSSPYGQQNGKDSPKKTSRNSRESLNH